MKRVRIGPMPPRQRGYVTVMVAILFGLAFSATVLGTAAYIHSTQSVSMASHAQVQAQLKAWTGAEIVREYLAAMQTANTLTALATTVSNGSTALTISGVAGVSATLTAVNSASNPTQFTATITGTTASGTPAQATSTIQAVYAVNAGTNNNQAPALNFNRNLVLGGSIAVQAPTGSTTQYTINVLGDVSTGGNSITGVSTINSTGTINIGSGSSFTQLNSNCDVVISGSVSAVSVSAQRNICETGGASVSGTALANGSVMTQTGESSNGTISALTNATPASTCSAVGASQNGTTAATCPTPTVNGVDLSFGAAGAAVVNTDGSVVLASGTIGKLLAAGTLTVTSAGAVTTGTVGGAVTKPVWNSSVNVTPNAHNTVSITPAVAVTLTTSQFNAYTVQSAANYQFQDVGGFLVVTVTNVNGIANGVYYLGNYGGGYQDYLCKTLSSPSAGVASPSESSQTCAGSYTSGFKICQGYSAYNSCFSYTPGTVSANETSTTGSWSINGTSMAPGIAWFEGNLTVGSGSYYNTFIATGNAATSGADKVFAPNYAGYSGTVGSDAYAPTGICSNSYFSSPSFYPIQFCTPATQTFNATASSGLGNYAFLAGSWTGTNYPGQAGYYGGNVAIGASSVIDGDIKAGNEFTSGGSTTIAGGVSALALGTAVENSMGGSTTFNLTNIPSTLNIQGGASGTGGGTGSTGGTVSFQWARYL